MGTGKRLKCNSCGYEWQLFEGTGCMNQEPGGNKVQDPTICTNCGSKDVDQAGLLLWD